MMKIVMMEQAVLELILDYWDNPSSTNLNTAKIKILELWPMGVLSQNPFLEFELTKESYKFISIKYFHKGFSNNNEWHTLQVDKSNLSMKLLSITEYLGNLSKIPNFCYIG